SDFLPAKFLAEKGDTYGQTFYGLCCPDVDKRVLLLKPAKQGNPMAQFQLVTKGGGSPNIHLFLESAASSGNLNAIELYLRYLLYQNRVHKLLNFVYRKCSSNFVKPLFNNFTEYRDWAKNDMSVIFKHG